MIVNGSTLSLPQYPTIPPQHTPLSPPRPQPVPAVHLPVLVKPPRATASQCHLWQWPGHVQQCPSFGFTLKVLAWLECRFQQPKVSGGLEPSSLGQRFAGPNSAKHMVVLKSAVGGNMRCSQTKAYILLGVNLRSLGSRPHISHWADQDGSDHSLSGCKTGLAE